MYEIRHYAWDTYCVVRVTNKKDIKIMFAGHVRICDKVLTNLLKYGINSAQDLKDRNTILIS